MDIVIIILMLVIVVVLLAIEKLSYLGASIVILCTLTISGILEPSETFKELANPMIMLYVGAFVISSAFIKVGMPEAVFKHCRPFLERFRHSESIVLLGLSVLTSILTIFLQALGVQIALLTIVITLSHQFGIGRKKALLALGFSATMGSTFTLMGNNVNLLAKAAYDALETGERWSFFELSKLTIPMGLVMMLFFCFVSSRWLKEEPDEAFSPEAVDNTEDESSNPPTRLQKWIVGICGIVFLLSIFLDGYIPVPPNIVVLICAAVLVMSRVMTSDEILGSINWSIILFTVAVLALSTGFMKVGAGDYLSELVVRLLGDQISLRTMVAIIFIVATLATQVLSNSGTFAIILPIAVPLAIRLQLPVKPIIVSLCLASSCAFLTPLSAPTFPLLSTTGKISFKEFLLQGIPPTIISTVACVIFIPMIWG